MWGSGVNGGWIENIGSKYCTLCGDCVTAVVPTTVGSVLTTQSSCYAFDYYDQLISVCGYRPHINNISYIYIEVELECTIK